MARSARACLHGCDRLGHVHRHATCDVVDHRVVGLPARAPAAAPHACVDRRRGRPSAQARPRTSAAANRAGVGAIGDHLLDRPGHGVGPYRGGVSASAGRPIDWPVVHPATFATAFATVFVAELPDKTMLATIVLSARFRRPLAVWIGAASALTTQMVIAAAAGRLLGLLPDRLVSAAVAVLFAVGAVLLWRSADEDPDVADATADAGADRRPWWRISATVFGVVFLAEWGDLTQLATASLASQATRSRCSSVPSRR